MELMFAGYFTSGSALTSCILELARHPNVFEKVQDELLANGFLKDSTSKTEPEPEITLKDVHNLKYMEQVLKETLRVRPPVLGGYRRARKTFQLGVSVFIDLVFYILNKYRICFMCFRWIISYERS